MEYLEGGVQLFLRIVFVDSILFYYYIYKGNMLELTLELCIV
jgi:hypothetical protein